MPGFSRKQKGIFQPIVTAAWKSYCETTDASLDRRTWYESELALATGAHSTRDLDKKGDFERACAHFEEIAGDNIYWQLRLHGGSSRRIIKRIRDKCIDLDVDEHYAAAVARQELQSDITPDLETLSAEDLLKVLRALSIKLHRDTKNPF